jgi:hypothetical protein
MSKIEVNINGQTYPCRLTMGALLLFKQTTGREATTLDGSSLSDLLTLVWCCIVSASRHAGQSFGLTLEEFADGMTPDDIEQVFSVLNDGGDPEAASVAQPAENGGEKKRPTP